jgi:carboxymethylenebutenolidase
MRLPHYQQYLAEEFAEDYKENRLSRRDLMQRVLIMTGSVPLTASVLFTLGCGGGDDTAKAPIATATKAATSAPASPTVASTPTGPNVAANDPALNAQDVSFAGPASQIKAYLAQPATGTSFPAVLVIHENRGLVDHTKDVARRYAKEGFVALAIDLLSRSGGTGQDVNANTGALGALASKPDDLAADLKAGVAYLKSQSFVKAVGVTGFCFGGGQVWEVAVIAPDLKAAVPYYGPIRAEVLDKLPQTNAAVLAFYGALDTRITSQSPDVEAKLKAAGKTVQIKVEENAAHAFFNDTGASYNKAAADDAWVLTLAWFRKYLTA